MIVNSNTLKLLDNEMPNYKGHLWGGLVAYMTVMLVVVKMSPSLVTGAEWLLCALAGALFPDIDIKSKGQKYFYWVFFVLFLFLFYRKQYGVLSCSSLFMFTPMLVRHRGIFHRYTFIIALPLCLWLTSTLLCPELSRPLFFNMAFFVAGGVSHIFLDRNWSKLFR
jgi:hypothetical protein